MADEMDPSQKPSTRAQLLKQLLVPGLIFLMAGGIVSLVRPALELHQRFR